MVVDIVPKAVSVKCNIPLYKKIFLYVSMFTSGHIAILSKVIKELLNEQLLNDMREQYNIYKIDTGQLGDNDNDESTRTMIKDILEKFEKKQSSIEGLKFSSLVDGLAYPDYPCASISPSTNDDKNNIFMHPKLCKPLDMIKQMAFHHFSLPYTSHNGDFSIWHAMTPNPSNKLQDVVNDIISEIKVFAFLATVESSSSTVRPNIFWIGVILHVVMDSYSKAHTFRLPTVSEITLRYDNDCKNICEKKHISDIPDVISAAKQFVKTPGTPGDVKAFLLETMTKYPDLFKTSKNVQDFRTLVYHIMFMHQQKQKMEAFLQASIPKVNVTDNPSQIVESSSSVPLVTVFYYPCQDSIFHKMNDRLSALEANEQLAKACVSDCKKILLTFFAFVHKSISAAEFVSDIVQYVTNVTFKMHESTKNLTTSYNIEDGTTLKRICSKYVQGGMKQGRNTNGKAKKRTPRASRMGR